MRRRPLLAVVALWTILLAVGVGSSATPATGALVRHARVQTLAAEDTGITAADGTEITGYTRHGLNRAIGEGPQAPGVAQRAGTDPGAILDALRNPQKITEGVDQFGRPFKVYSGSNARVVVIDREWRELGADPNIPDICWFANTEYGDEIARELANPRVFLLSDLDQLEGFKVLP